ncbi:MAG: MBL fold metallo-hydrolase [Vicinamibacteria bacterium]
MGAVVPPHEAWRPAFHHYEVIYNWLFEQSLARTRKGEVAPSALYTVRDIGGGVKQVWDYYLGTVYVIERKDKALLVDTGMGSGSLLEFVRSHVLANADVPLEVAITHDHFDHISGSGFGRRLAAADGLRPRGGRGGGRARAEGGRGEDPAGRRRGPDPAGRRRRRGDRRTRPHLRLGRLPARGEPSTPATRSAPGTRGSASRRCRSRSTRARSATAGPHRRAGAPRARRAHRRVPRR